MEEEVLRYYKWQYKSGKVYRLLASYTPPGYGKPIEIDKDEFYRIADEIHVFPIIPTAPSVLAQQKRPPTTDERVKILEAQNQALTDRNDFLEDCIAEMAAVVYADPELSV